MAARKMKGSWWVDFQIHHVRYRYRSPHNSREGAKAYESLLRQKMANGERIEDFVALRKKSEASNLFRSFAERWYTTYVLPNNKASTQRSKRNALDNHLVPWFGEMELEDIGVLRIDEFKAQKLNDGLSSKSINNILSVLRKSLTCAEEWGIIEKVPRIKWLRVPPSRYKFLNVVDTEKLLNGADNIFWYAMILCALRTGMRIGELCALDWSDINWNQQTLTVRRSVVEGVIDSPKNNRIRIIPMAKDLHDLFYAKRLEVGLVFPGPDGNHMRKSSWPWKALTRACKRAGLPVIGWHVLRHTFASELTARSVPMKATQLLLGHSTIQMTERYAHLAPSVLQDAVAVLPKSMVGENSFVEGGVNLASTNWSRNCVWQ